MANIGQLLICLGVVCLFIGVVLTVTQSSGGLSGLLGGTGEDLEPAEDRPWRTDLARPIRTGRSRRPTPRSRPASRQPPPAVNRSSDSMQDRFFNARLGQTVVFNHPQRGPITGQVLGRIHYTELWQRVNRPSEPWVPTGNTFAALWFGSYLLYQWQNRLYVLDQYDALSDQDIQANFLPYARRFAQSDQTAQVSFAWPPASWTIVDIGKFSVALAEGTGLRLNQDAVGRFIHARGADNRALVVEDYQEGGGGQDTAWTGWELAWPDIQKIA